MYCSVVDCDGLYIQVTADVQNTEVRLRPPQIRLSELYVGLEQSVSVTVENKTCLPTAVFWGTQLPYTQTFATVSVTPLCAIIKPGQHLHADVSVMPNVMVRSPFMKVLTHSLLSATLMAGLFTLLLLCTITVLLLRIQIYSIRNLLETFIWLQHHVTKTTFLILVRF